MLVFFTIVDFLQISFHNYQYYYGFLLFNFRNFIDFFLSESYSMRIISYSCFSSFDLTDQSIVPD